MPGVDSNKKKRFLNSVQYNLEKKVSKTFRITFDQPKAKEALSSFH